MNFPRLLDGEKVLELLLSQIFHGDGIAKMNP
jgi:hypothetical protein